MYCVKYLASHFVITFICKRDGCFCDSLIFPTLSHDHKHVGTCLGKIKHALFSCQLETWLVLIEDVVYGYHQAGYM